MAAAMAALMACAPGAVVAMDDPTPVMSPDHQAGKRAIDAKDWNAAISALTTAEQREANNAEVHNLLGYAYRNSGKLDLAFKHYVRALQLNPRHLGAHEYVGEAYLMTNNLPKAEEHLASLKRFCSRVCDERDALEKQIVEYKRRSAAAK
jgi:Flp pilus assembly protein TadD